MQEFTPNYYEKFRCIADKCKHNCCIGWEIVIDEETMKKYEALSSDLGKRIRENTEGNPVHFVLKEGDRCPFLNDKNLCDIISELGENGLCEICHLHPRFRNFYSDFCETGLGLCCEEAARIVLSEEKFCINISDSIEKTDDECEFLELRSEIFSVLQNRNDSVKLRLEKLASMFDLEFSFDLKSLAEFLLSLERLDENWTVELESLKKYSFDESVFTDGRYSLYFENLACYFVFRHLHGALDFGDYEERIKFVLVSCYVIGALWSKNGCESVEEMAEFARMYSCEIEYSEDNTYEIFDA